MDQLIIPVIPPVQEDAWSSLRAFTAARIALGRTGVAVPLREALSFRLAHAHARDAVHASLNTTQLIADLQQAFPLPVFVLHSQAAHRQEYLQRPDLGRKLDPPSIQQLEEAACTPTDIAILLADGLSATAVQAHVVPLLKELIPLLQSARFSFAPIAIIQQGRVGISDETAALLNARLSLILIGERPGLTSADSLGAYLTYGPKAGLTDESRNCVSNIRPEGLSYEAAAHRLYNLIYQSLQLQLSGVALKDNSTQQLPGFIHHKLT
jgi:ethanolamine ammonia-lyase small subunit